MLLFKGIIFSATPPTLLLLLRLLLLLLLGGVHPLAPANSIVRIARAPMAPFPAYPSAFLRVLTSS